MCSSGMFLGRVFHLPLLLDVAGIEPGSKITKPPNYAAQQTAGSLYAVWQTGSWLFLRLFLFFFNSVIN